MPKHITRDLIIILKRKYDPHIFLVLAALIPILALAYILLDTL